jgi:RNA polymerase sigma-70 factor (ECF subfamily)
MFNEMAPMPIACSQPLAGAECGEPVRLLEFASEEHFRAFYERTVRPLYGYLNRVLQDPARAEDLAQECYLRMMRADLPGGDFAHRKNYLFRVATNLLHDAFRAAKRDADMPGDIAQEGFGRSADLSHDVQAALGTLSPRDRQILWLAYVERFSHREIAKWTGLKEASLRPMLLRARQRLANELREKGIMA